MTEGQPSKVMQTARRMQPLANGMNALVAGLDSRTLFGFGMVALAIIIASYPDKGVAISMDAMGISPRGFSILLAIAGGAMLRVQDVRIYALCTLPYLVFLVALTDYIIRTNSTPLSLVPSVLVFLNMVRAKGG